MHSVLPGFKSHLLPSRFLNREISLASALAREIEAKYRFRSMLDSRAQSLFR